jgi:hypothetical protein
LGPVVHARSTEHAAAPFQNAVIGHRLPPAVPGRPVAESGGANAQVRGAFRHARCRLRRASASAYSFVSEGKNMHRGTASARGEMMDTAPRHLKDNNNARLLDQHRRGLLGS